MYVKLFSDLLTSSVWQLTPALRCVWIALLCLADRMGFVRATEGAIARAANVSLAKTREALEIFAAPDPSSRSQEHEGRRIERFPSGLRIVNYEKYRGMRDEETRREYMRKYMQDYRIASCKPAVNHSKPPLAHADADADADNNEQQQHPPLPPKNGGRVPKRPKRKELSMTAAETNDALQKVLELWNAWLTKHEWPGGLRKIPAPSTDRGKMLRARVAEEGWLADFEAALVEAEKSDFLMGRVKDLRWPHMTLDFILRPDRVERVVAGEFRLVPNPGAGLRF